MSIKEQEIQDIALFQGIFQASVEGILVVGADGIIIKTNPASEKLFGYTTGELIGQKIENLIPKNLKKKHKSHRKVYSIQPKARKMGHNQKLWGLKKDGDQFPLEISLSPTTINQRQVIIAFVIDISEREKIEKKLNISQKKLQMHSKELEKKVAKRTSELTTTVQKLVASNLSLEDQIEETQEAEQNAIVSKSLSSAIAKNFPNGFIIVFNINFEMLLIEGEAVVPLGLDKMNFKDKNVDEIAIFSFKQKIKLKQDILKTIVGEHLGFEIMYRNQYFSVNTIPLLDKDAVISSALFVYSNITTQKEIERVAKSALKKEKELNELKSRFITTASHEFRTPLSAILTSAILIEKLNAPGKEIKRLNHVSKIRTSVKNLVVILNDFLSLGKLQEGKVAPQYNLFDIISFSKSLIKEINETKKEGQIIIFKAQKAAINICLDPKLLRHILFNLLSNAIKYSAENTSIILKIAIIQEQLIIEIRDFGIGIPLEDQKNIFSRFYRANNVANIEGTGLGLNIAKQCVGLMGGAVSFESTLNKGTQFYINFPLKKENK
jgi:PAS domain S-box-containing protein